MNCEHKEYDEMDVFFLTWHRVAGTGKIMQTKSHICLCRECGVLFVPFELRNLPLLDTMTDNSLLKIFQPNVDCNKRGGEHNGKVL